MTPKRWQQVERIFEAAIERDPAQRASFLDEACAGDEQLRSEVESLLAADRQAGSFIEPDQLEPPTRLFIDDQARSMAGRRFGPYKIIREIGHGGMGAVFLAIRADDQYQKRVAIKLIKRGMDTQQIIRRFLSERQILAALDHPNIARLIDGGTTDDGLPYFVMEYIEGKPIGEFCDARTLSTAERLKLFRLVCSAVQYAHQNLVVHRDIKPSNILVTSEGVPKLLDFGLAKLLNPELNFQTIDPTATALRMMTPDYASPEQVRGETITTSSDVYSLGVVLYELLTGHRPYRFKSYLPHEIVRVICEEEPEKPSTAITRVEEVTTSSGPGRITVTAETVSKTREGQPEKLRRRLAGDLDNIVLKAMRKEVQRRYTSVEQLSEDIRRHLEGLPVIARKDTLSYRSGKFIKRHKAAVITAGLIVLILVAGITAILWQARQVSLQRARAERRFNDVRKLANSFMFEFHDEIENIAGTTKARELLVKRALEYLDSLAQEAGDDPSLQRELAMAYVKVGDVQGGPGGPNWGDTAGTLESHLRALAIREALVAADPTNAQALGDLARSYDTIGFILVGLEAPGRLESRGKALEIFEALAAADPKNVKVLRDLANMYSAIANDLRQTGDTGDIAKSIEYYRKTPAIWEELLSSDPTNVELRWAVGWSYCDNGDMLEMAGDKAGAQENYRKALEYFEVPSTADPKNVEDLSGLATRYSTIAGILSKTGDTAKAIEYYRKSMVIQERLVAADPAKFDARRRLAYAYRDLGEGLRDIGDTAGTLEYYYKALAIFEGLSAAEPADEFARNEMANFYIRIAMLKEATRDTSGALESYRKYSAICEWLVAADPTNAWNRARLGHSYGAVGKMLAKVGDTAMALKSYRKGLAILEFLVTTDPMNMQARRGLAESYFDLAKVYVMIASDAKTPVVKQMERWREARSWYQRSLNIWLDMRNNGTLTGDKAGKADEITREIAKCDAALAKLKAK